MNLYYDSSAMSLRQLLGKANKSLSVHNVVVDYDGEVIIDPELHFSDVPLDKYKYRTLISNPEKANERNIQTLLNSLLAGYDSGEHHIYLSKSLRRAA